MTDTPAITPPPIWYQAQRVLRTGLAVLTTLLTTWAAFALIAPDILAELAKVLPGPWVVWLTGAVSTITLVAGVITRIMAIAKVNEILTKVGFGSVPKSKLVPIDGDTTVVIPDVKAITAGE